MFHKLFSEIIYDISIALLGGALLITLGWTLSIIKKIIRGREPSSNVAIWSRILKRKRILIYKTGNAGYAHAISAVVNSTLRIIGQEKGIDCIVKEEELSEVDSDYLENEADIEEDVKSFEPDIIVTVGSTASVHIKKYRSQSQKKMLIPQVFTGLSDPVALDLVRTLKADRNRGALAGTVFGLTLENRIGLVMDVVKPQNLAFVCGVDIPADIKMAESVINFMLKNHPNVNCWRVDYVSDDKCALERSQLAGADAIIGWYFLHQHIETFLQLATCPIVGGGSVDARLGAALSIADTEETIANITVNELIIPFLLGNKGLEEMDILRPIDVIDNYQPLIYFNKSSIARFDILYDRNKYNNVVFYN